MAMLFPTEDNDPTKLIEELRNYLNRPSVNQSTPFVQSAPQQAMPVVDQEMSPSTMSPSGISPSGMSYLQRALALTEQQPDTAALQEYARARQAQGQQSMLNALAAGIAGPQYQGLQQGYLRRAMAAQEPEQVGSGMAYGGKYITDPYAGRKEQTSMLSDIGKAIIDAETEASRAAAADKRLEMMYSPERVTPGERQQSGRRIIQLAEKFDAASQALSAIPTMEEALKNVPEGYFGPLIAETAKIASSLGVSRADKIAAGSQLADAISKQFGIAKLSDIGGNDTDRELMTAIATTYDGTNLREVNQKLLKLFTDVSKRNIAKFNEAQRWSENYGSIFRIGSDDQTFDEYFDKKYKEGNIESSNFGSEDSYSASYDPNAVQLKSK